MSRRGGRTSSKPPTARSRCAREAPVCRSQILVRRSELAGNRQEIVPRGEHVKRVLRVGVGRAAIDAVEHLHLAVEEIAHLEADLDAAQKTLAGLPPVPNRAVGEPVAGTLGG